MNRFGPDSKTCEQCGAEYGRVAANGARRQNFHGKRFCGPVCSQVARKKDQGECFWSKVDKSGASGCWNWTASRKEKGYGQFFWRGKMHRAHRLAWTLTGRELPARPLELAHRCDNRVCVNPDHLFVATHAENMADCKAKGRYARTGNKPRGATA